jgi:hypothetical protein
VRTKLALIAVAAAAIAGTVAIAQPSETPAAANVCAKLAEADCGAKDGCSWLPGYKIPNGAEIPGYCRPSPRPLEARRPGARGATPDQPKQ